jgi:hypothetical protein
MEMHYTNILLTIAEISGVLVGFANLASVFEKPNEDVVLRQQNKLRLLVITEGGIFGIFACLLPFLVMTFDYNEIIAFRVTAIILTPVTLISYVFNLKRARRLTGTPILVSMSGLPTAKKVGSIMTGIMILLVITPLTLIGAGIFDDGPIAGVFCLSMLSIFSGMCIVLIRFIRQVIS